MFVWVKEEKVFCLPGDFPVSPRNSLFKTISWVTLITWTQKVLSSERCSVCLQRDLTMDLHSRVFSSVTDEWTFSRASSKQNYHINSSILCPRKPNNDMSRVLPSVSDKQPFHDHLLTKTIISTP